MNPHFRTTHGRKLKAVPTPEQRPSPTRLWICRRRLHIFSLPTKVCAECSVYAPPSLVGVDEFEQVDP